MTEDCTFEDEEYPDGSEICRLLRCVICRKGQWVNVKNHDLAVLLGQPFCRGMRPL